MNTSSDYRAVAELLQRPIAFHRVFVTITGSVLAGLMLSQAFYWHPRGTLPDNWFHKTQKEWEEETGMSRWEQETARKKLRQTRAPDGTPVWEEERRGLPAKMHYRVNIAALWACIESHPAIQYVVFPHTGTRQNHKQEGGDTADKSDASPQTFNNTKTTTYISSKSAPPTQGRKQDAPADLMRYRPPADIDPLSR